MFPLAKESFEDNLTKDDIQFIRRLERKIYDSGFVTPSVFFLEMIRPLSSLGGHAMVFMGPIINGFIQSDGYYNAAALIYNAESFTILFDVIDRLELLDSNDGKRH